MSEEYNEYLFQFLHRIPPEPRDVSIYGTSTFQFLHRIPLIVVSDLSLRVISLSIPSPDSTEI